MLTYISVCILIYLIYMSIYNTYTYKDIYILIYMYSYVYILI